MVYRDTALANQMRELFYQGGDANCAMFRCAGVLGLRIPGVAVGNWRDTPRFASILSHE